ncbi:MAG TPA: DUF2802 domain-containing protein [Thermodesulfobacteriota bacterium]|nr:DUF2802 domain-containing protein [Thermodesulfobacteriota bacterium]
MTALWIVFLAFDVALLGAIFYILAFRKSASRRFAPDVASGSEARNGAAPSILMELKTELAAARKTVSELEKKRVELDAFERMLRERYSKLDEILKKAAESAKEVEVIRDGRASEDTYYKAMKLLRLGLPVDEVVKNLGILKGEAELISAINDYRQ